MRKLFISGLLILLVLVPFAASGTELGLTSYPDGIENFFCRSLSATRVLFAELLALLQGR